MEHVEPKFCRTNFHQSQIFGERNTAFVNTSNPEKSNWFRYVRPAGFRERRNVVSVFKNGEMYFVSTRDIDKGQEVLFWTDDPNLAWDNNQTDSTGNF